MPTSDPPPPRNRKRKFAGLARLVRRAREEWAPRALELTKRATTNGAALAGQLAKNVREKGGPLATRAASTGSRLVRDAAGWVAQKAVPAAKQVSRRGLEIGRHGWKAGVAGATRLTKRLGGLRKPGRRAECPPAAPPAMQVPDHEVPPAAESLMQMPAEDVSPAAETPVQFPEEELTPAIESAMEAPEEEVPSAAEPVMEVPAEEEVSPALHSSTPEPGPDGLPTAPEEPPAAVKRAPPPPPADPYASSNKGPPPAPANPYGATPSVPPPPPPQVVPREKAPAALPAWFRMPKRKGPGGIAGALQLLKELRHGRVQRWAIPVALLVLAAFIGLNLLGKMKREVWAYYSDDQGTRAAVSEEKTRYVLWEDPQPHNFQEQRDPKNKNPDVVNQPAGRLEAAYSPAGNMMVLVRWEAADTNADLYLSHWDGRVWSRPEPIEAINTPRHNERGPAFSQDGRYLYFSSDRPGGAGGYDLYVARWNAAKWDAIASLGLTVNSEGDDAGPAPAADGSRLYFSSDRAGAKSEDIFVAVALPDDEPTPDQKQPKPDRKKKKKKAKKNQEIKAGELPPVPRFETAEAVNHLNSHQHDVQAALTSRGDHVFLASDRDRTRRSGYGVYFSRVVEGAALPPERVDLYIDRGDVTDPAVRMEGFDLLFSSDHEAAAAGEEGEKYRLYRTTSREVIGFTDLSRWEQFKELMKNIAWWIFLALAALIALIYLLESWQDITSLFHKCLAGSAAAHLLLLLLMMVWLIAKQFEKEAEPPPPEMNISVDALTEEELALESAPDESEIAQPDLSLPTEKMQAAFDVPDFQPQDNNNAVPIDSEFSQEAAQVEVKPTNADPAEEHETQPTEESQLLSELSETALPEPEPPVLEERLLADAPEPVNPAEAEFKPNQSMPAASQAETRELTDTAVETPTEVAQIEPSESIADNPAPTPLTEVQPSQSDQSPSDQPDSPEPLESELLAALPDAAPINPENPLLEEPSRDVADNPADSAEDLFNPSDSIPKVATTQAEGNPLGDSAAPSQADAAEVANGGIAATPVAQGPAAVVGEAQGEADLPEPAADSGLPQDLPETALLDPGAPRLEEGDPRDNPPANPAVDVFKPGRGVAQPAGQIEGTPVADAAVPSQTNAAEVATGKISPTPITGGPSPVVGEAATEQSLPESGAPALASNLPASNLLDPGAPRLEEGDQQPGAPANPANDLFKPGGAATSNQAQGQAIADNAVAKPAGSGEVAKGELAATPAPPGSSSAVGEAATEPTLPEGGTLAGDLPQSELLDPGAPRLEEGDQRAGAPADPGKDMFKPGGAQPTSNQAQGQAVADNAVANPADSGAVAQGELASTPATQGSSSAVGEAATEQSLPEGGALANNLPESDLLDPGAPQLEEGDQQPGAPANPGEDTFKPGGSQLVSTRAPGQAVADSAAADSPAAGAVAGGGLVANVSNLSNPQQGLEATGSDPAAGGGLLGPATLDPSPTTGSLLPGQLEAPKIDTGAMTNFLKRQRGRPSMGVIKQLGGSDGTEKAIRASLQWLVENQVDNGRWNAREHGAKGEFDTGVTGLALLCFYGWGVRHDQEGEFQDQVRKALDWLISRQKETGDLSGGGLMYCHAIASIALCEAYGITKDPKLRPPAERAIAYTLAAQSKTKGGWRYHPGNDSDTSITGWQYMALHSARMAGLTVPEESFKLVRKWLDRAGGGKHGGLYGYQAPARNSPAMVATGMFCRQLDLVPPTEPMMSESAAMLKRHPMESSYLDFYYIYYGTLALYQHQGPIWEAWNERLKEIVPLSQNKTGKKAGSWAPSRGLAGNGGRVASTALATLSLEVYYRLLPMYGFRGNEAPPVKLKGDEDDE